MPLHPPSPFRAGAAGKVEAPTENAACSAAAGAGASGAGGVGDDTVEPHPVAFARVGGLHALPDPAAGAIGKDQAILFLTGLPLAKAPNELLPARTIFGMNQLRAQGTSLGALLAPVGILAFYEYYRKGNADLRIALLLALGFVVGGYFGAIGAQHIPDLWLRRIFAVALILVGARMWFGR